MMFADYTKLVLQDYEKKRAENALPLSLIHPTPAKLKEVSLAMRNQRYDRKKDEVALAGFFGQGEDSSAILQAIKRFDIDKFKPLINFLRKPTIKTDEKNIELLAWLINFEQRPYELGKSYEINDPEGARSVGEHVEENGSEIKEGTGLPEEGFNDGVANSFDPEPEQDPAALEETKEWTQPEEPTPEKERPMSAEMSHTPAPQSGARVKISIAIISVIAVVLAGMLIYGGEKNKKEAIPMRRSLQGNEACMYWAGDRYLQISCAEKLGDTLIIALDPEKLRSFKKITRPDTITNKSKGAVWYVKVGGHIEFYTADGFHPVDPQLRLRPVTDYIIRKYIVAAE